MCLQCIHEESAYLSKKSTRKLPKRILNEILSGINNLLLPPGDLQFIN
jgi:hypothetical protein